MLILSYSNAFAASRDIAAKNLETRVVEKSAGYTRVSVKMEAMNYGEPANVYIKYRALDFSGYELETGLIRSTFQKFDNKSLTDSMYIKNGVFDKIHKWEIGQIDTYPAQ